MKNQFVNSLPGGLQNLLVKEENVLNKTIDQMIHGVTSVGTDAVVSFIKVSAVNF